MKSLFKHNRTLFLVGAGIFAIVLLGLGSLLSPRYAPSAETMAFVKDAVSNQQKIETEIRSYYQSGKFTFGAPMVLQDPYQSAPLTALVIFDTHEASQISIHVPGKTLQAAVDVTFPGYQQHHEIPIYGLYAGTLNHVTMRMKMQNGTSAQTGIDLQTEPLPVDMQNFTVDKLDRGLYSPGFNFTSLDRKQVFDLDGNVRWYSSQKSWEVFTPLKNGHFLFTYTVSKVEGDLMMEQDLLGKIYSIYNIPDGVHHDVYELPTGNLLVTSADLKSNTIEDYILEVDRNSGHIVKDIDLKNILDPGRPRQVIGLPTNDWLHLNSIVYDPADRSIIISSKAQSAVVKLTYPGMQIKWILGPHDNWSPKYQPYLLTPVGDNFEWPWSQHHATLYAPDVPGSGSTDILLFDNALYRSFTTSSAFPFSEWYSMLVHYRINEASRTVEEVWEYGKERGPALFSAVGGSAYRLSNGDVLGTWGDISKDTMGNPSFSSDANDTVNTKIIEVDPSTSVVVFETSAPHTADYRTLRAGLYDGYAEGNDFLAKPINNTTGNDLADRSFLAWRDIKRATLTPLLAWLKNLHQIILTKIK